MRSEFAAPESSHAPERAGKRSFARDNVLVIMTAGIFACGRAEAADLESARQQFLKSCGTCHTAVKGEPNRQGPNLFGVYGRPAGSLASFIYSDALRGGRWVWNEPELDRWIENAQEAHPGTFMTYSQSDPDKRALIIAFLKSEAAGGAGP